MTEAATGPALPENTAGPKRIGPAESETGQALALRSAEFRKGRERTWRRLDYLVGRAEQKGLNSLEAEEARLLPLLYRSAVSSLSVARSIALDRNLLLYLEDLALRSYLVVYGPRTGLFQNVRDFAAWGFPRSVRELRRHMLVVFLVLMAAIIAGYALVMSDMTYYNMLIPGDLAGWRTPGVTAQELRDKELFAPWPGFVPTFIVFANALFTHNSVVGILAFSLGFALGVPTIILVAYNGLGIGAMIALHADVGLTADFIGWLSIHGVTELLALILCGAAGLRIAEVIIFPGRLPRLESLSLYGRRAAGVAVGAVGLDFVAAILEGGFRQLINNTPGRYAFALMTAAAWLYYFVRAGKDREDDRLDD